MHKIHLQATISYRYFTTRPAHNQYCKKLTCMHPSRTFVTIENKNSIFLTTTIGTFYRIGNRKSSFIINSIMTVQFRHFKQDISLYCSIPIT